MTFTARGASMWPAVRDGALVRVTPCPMDLLRVGDLAAVDRRGELLVHRVISRSRDAVVLRGDSMPAPDGSFDADRFLGRAEVVEQRPLRPGLPSRWHLVALFRWAARAAAERLRDAAHPKPTSAP